MKDPALERWGFVSDDLTGACLVGGLVADAGLSCLVVTEPRDDAAMAALDTPWQRVQVIGCSAESRVASSSEAFNRVREAKSWLVQRGCRRFLKFVDSTLRGNLGSELDAMLADAAGGRAIVVPGTPSAGRTVQGGRLYCEGVPALRSPLGTHDALSPLGSDRVTRLFGRFSSMRYVALGERVPGDPTTDPRRLRAILAQLLTDGEVPIVDAHDAAMIERCLAAVMHPDFLPTVDVLCGSAGLASAWARELAVRGWGSSAQSAGATAGESGAAHQANATLREGTHGGVEAGAPVLLVCGSRSPASTAQIAQLARAGRAIIRYPPQPWASDDDSVARLVRALEERGAAVLVAADGGPGREPPEVQPRRAAVLVDALARLAVSAMQRAGARTLVLVGGMTAEAVLRAAGVHLLEPQEQGDFVVRSVGWTAAGAALNVVTKGGSAGAEEVLERTLERLERGSPLRTSDDWDVD